MKEQARRRKVRELWLKEYTQYEIADELGVSRSTGEETWGQEGWS